MNEQQLSIGPGVTRGVHGQILTEAFFKLCGDKELLPKAQRPSNTNPYSEIGDNQQQNCLSSLSPLILCSQLQISAV
jgi:hypothetical protein